MVGMCLSVRMRGVGLGSKDQESRSPFASVIHISLRSKESRCFHKQIPPAPALVISQSKATNAPPEVRLIVIISLANE